MVPDYYERLEEKVDFDAKDIIFTAAARRALVVIESRSLSVLLSLFPSVMSHFLGLCLVKRGNVTSPRRSLRLMSPTKATYLLH